jgi:hypothetical protein
MGFLFFCFNFWRKSIAYWSPRHYFLHFPSNVLIHIFLQKTSDSDSSSLSLPCSSAMTQVNYFRQIFRSEIWKQDYKSWKLISSPMYQTLRWWIQTTQVTCLCRITEAPSCTHCYSWNAINITYSECVSVALGIQHAMRMRHVAICGLSFSTTFFPHFFINGRFS